MKKETTYTLYLTVTLLWLALTQMIFTLFLSGEELFDFYLLRPCTFGVLCGLWIIFGFLMLFIGEKIEVPEDIERHQLGTLKYVVKNDDKIAPVKQLFQRSLKDKCILIASLSVVVILFIIFELWWFQTSREIYLSIFFIRQSILYVVFFVEIIVIILLFVRSVIKHKKLYKSFGIFREFEIHKELLKKIDESQQSSKSISVQGPHISEKIVEVIDSMNEVNDVITFSVDDYLVQVLFSLKAPESERYNIVFFVYEPENTFDSEPTSQFKEKLISYYTSMGLKWEKSLDNCPEKIFIYVASPKKVAEITEGIFENVFGKRNYTLTIDSPSSVQLTDEEKRELVQLQGKVIYHDFVNKRFACGKCGGKNFEYKEVVSDDVSGKAIVDHIYTCKDCGDTWHWRDDDTQI